MLAAKSLTFRIGFAWCRIADDMPSLHDFRGCSCEQNGPSHLHWKSCQNARELHSKRSQEIFVSQRTFSIIKPDAVKKGDTAAILAKISDAGFKLIAIKKIVLTKQQAEGFYYVHAERGFFGELTDFMSSGVIYPMVLEKDKPIADLRKPKG